MKLIRENTNLKTIGLITGLAAGAVVAALFATKSGSEYRELIAKRIKGLLGEIEEKKPVEIKDQVVEDVRSHVAEAANKLSGNLEDVDLTKTTLKHTEPKSRQLPIES
jgi:gas vesicle protein